MTRSRRADLFVVALCGSLAVFAQETAPNTLTPAEQREGWQLLFDGRTLDKWRGYGKPAPPDGWQVVDATITRVRGGGDLMTKEQFENFALGLEWRISPGGNSGIMFRVIEGLEGPYRSGPEMQILDNARHADGKVRETTAGSNYALHAPVRDVTRPVGSWNAVRLVVNGSQVEHWLNDVKVVEYELGSADWLARVKPSKFNDWPEYGRPKRGHIVLQDHGDVVAFRNLKIRALK
jgi:hypothetical protein